VLARKDPCRTCLPRGRARPFAGQVAGVHPPTP
jgi:hypothetical protein